MHVALVSTYPPTQCGIARYTRCLVGALRNEGVKVTVLAETVDGTAAEVDTLRCWHRRRDWVTDIAAELRRLSPDLVHVQHEEAILGQDARLRALLAHARQLGIASVVTLHSVYSGSLGVPGIRLSGRRFQTGLAQAADRLIVHQSEGCHDTLIHQGISEDKISVIAHGTSLLPPRNKAQARGELGLAADGPLILAIGFIHKRKGVHTLVAALPLLRERGLGARLVVAGSFRERPWDRLYNRRLRRALAPGLRDGSIDLREGFHSSETMHTLLAAADLLALPYEQAYGSASGILHLALGAGVPVLCASGYKFAEARRALGSVHLFPPANDPSAWAAAMAEMLGDANRLASLARASRELGEATSWSRIAQQHRTSYAQTLSGIHNAR